MFPVAPFSPDGFSAVTAAMEKIAAIAANIGLFIIYIAASIAKFEGSCKFKKTDCRFILHLLSLNTLHSYLEALLDSIGPNR
jgi:hypothetical protein